ncbi:UvrB/UvrC motif-containing protein [Aneurinibacillus soli]|uniref:UvrABC system protein C n=1 Tax=Aneurinibacillus soli TaxID=1500254 RepID=A0A0U5BBQ5_9BACL|nr:GIY-YIG nuclease family protein [Aneurinibacillus soli]PYE64399.1 UvrB/UvrC motif-containing protein [Aneurinibacillus soli]BAU28348.1 UvrABC system protein C [Aneurinibacillus soli]
MLYTITPGFHLTLPEKCGVYIYRDKDENIIYIGKAKNLKKRISTYFYQNKQHTAKTKRMVHAARTVEVRYTASELEALLLEARLIRRHLPLYNRALRNYKAYPFLVLRTDLTAPYVEVSRDTVHEDAMYFGPYHKTNWLHNAVDSLNSWLKLRRCLGPLPSSSCLYADLGQCLAPCITIDKDNVYNEQVKKARAILDGDPKMKQRLETLRDEAVDDLHFEEAARIQTLVNLAGYNSLLTRSVAHHHALVVSYDADVGCTGLIIVHGRLLRTLHTLDRTADVIRTMQEEARDLYKQTVGTLAAPTVEEVDEMLIIASWLEYRLKELDIYPLGP